MPFDEKIRRLFINLDNCTEPSSRVIREISVILSFMIDERLFINLDNCIAPTITLNGDFFYYLD